MNTNTPETDAEAALMTLDCDDSCVEIYIKRVGKYVVGDFILADFARRLERGPVGKKFAPVSPGARERRQRRRRRARSPRS